MTKKQLADALDNSQSLLVMIKHVGPNAKLWSMEGIDDLLAKQIVENRSILSAPPPAGAETAEQWSARWQKAKEEMANLPAGPDAEQIRDTLRTHIFVNRRHEAAGLDEAAQAVLALLK